MEERKTLFDYMGQVFMIFGITMLILSFLDLIFGENAKEYSTMFSLGKEGIGVGTIFQFLLASVITVTLRALFFYGYAVSEYARGPAGGGYGDIGIACDHCAGNGFRLVPGR